MTDETPKAWTHTGDKFTIGTIDGAQVEITAQYNPKEIAFASTASWNVHKGTNGGQANSDECHVALDYGSTESRTLTVELLFDGYEENLSVDPMVHQLEKLLVPIDPSSSKARKRRPQLCVAVWGTARPFRCVVLSVQSKITMFSRSGTPLRAICNVTLKEVDTVSMLANDTYRGNRVRAGRANQAGDNRALDRSQGRDLE